MVGLSKVAFGARGEQQHAVAIVTIIWLYNTLLVYACTYTW